jgi:hypothetical protein
MLIVQRRRVQQILWTPSQIATAIWLDASDSSSVVTVSGAVSQWNDKSGNNRNATQGTSARQPVYTSARLNGLNVITFDGADDFMDITTTLFQVALGEFQLHWVFARLGAGTGSGGYGPTISTIIGTNDDGALHYVKNTGSIGASYPFVRNAGWGNYDLASGTQYVNNQANIMSFTAGSTAWQVTRNGALEGGANRGSGLSSGITGLRLAQQTAPLRTSNIYLAEIAMILSGSVSTRQLVEGYLAHKWGQVSGLPSNHPYKTAPPYV